MIRSIFHSQKSLFEKTQFFFVFFLRNSIYPNPVIEIWAKNKQIVVRLRRIKIWIFPQKIIFCHFFGRSVKEEFQFKRDIMRYTLSKRDAYALSTTFLVGIKKKKKEKHEFFHAHLYNIIYINRKKYNKT